MQPQAEQRRQLVLFSYRNCDRLGLGNIASRLVVECPDERQRKGFSGCHPCTGFFVSSHILRCFAPLI